LFTTIKAKEHENSTNFENFLDEIDLTKSDYILAIQSTLKQTMVFLKQKPSHIWINRFAMDMPNLWNANTDVQYVLNAYVATSYCSSYMTEFDKSMINAFKRIHNYHVKNKIDDIQMIRTLDNKLLNLQQISSHQIVHIVLSLPLNHSSRQHVLWKNKHLSLSHQFF
jgi:hypothetical protein